MPAPRPPCRCFSRELKRIGHDRQRCVVWGAGSKGVTFLNTLHTQDLVEYVVDINPHKQGMFVAGTGQRVVAPEFLQEYKPDVILVMNPIYQSEIKQIINGLNIDAELMPA